MFWHVFCLSTKDCLFYICWKLVGVCTWEVSVKKVSVSVSLLIVKTNGIFNSGFYRLNTDC